MSDYLPSAFLNTKKEQLDSFSDLLGGLEKSEKVPQLPWDDGTQFHGIENEVFFAPFLIDPDRWDKFFPYRLLVVDVANGNQIVGVSGDSTTVYSKFTQETSSTGIEYVIHQEARAKIWEMVFPITPQQLQITDQFAINTSATMRGVVEEHNGVKFKMITASGTTGIWPLKPTVGGNITRPSSLESIFAGAIEGFSSLSEQVKNIKSAATGKHPNNPPPATKPGKSGVGSSASTGYYQALYLGQFLERYAQAKKHPSWKNYRLVLDMPKQNQSFVVTPMQFSLIQNQQKPSQYQFTIQLKAWKRIILNEVPRAAASSLPDIGSPSEWDRFVNTINATRQALGSATNLVKAVRSDFQGVFNNLRQMSLVIKDTAGLVFSAIDLPRQILDDLGSAIEDSVANTLDAFTPPTDRFRDQPGVAGSVNKFLDTAGLSPSSKAGAIAQSMTNLRKTNEGLSREAIKSGALGTEAAQRTSTDTINNIFKNPEENFDFFDKISLDDIRLSPEQEASIEDEIEKTRLLTVNDFRDIKADLLNLANQIADNFGAGNTTYSSIYGLPDPKERALPLSAEENEILNSIFEAIQTIDLLTATKQFDDLNSEDPLEFVGGLATESGIDFLNSPSKLAVPVPFGSTIEEIAGRYLQDSSRWLEIVTINKLRSPYIDEEGFFYNFLSNASGRQINVDDTEDKLYIGQSIVLLSNTIPAFSRKITNLEKIGENNYLVTVDGLNNLDTLTTADNARLQAYLPGTVNSQNQIYIPTSEPSESDDRTYEIPGISDNKLAKLSKVDILLTDNFDVAINSVGDFRLANGLTNLIQALKLKIRTQKGSILRHLDYGLGLEHGVSVADIENGVIINELNKMIAEDGRFQSITSITVRLSGSSLLIDMSVQLANQTGVLPINFDLKVA